MNQNKSGTQPMNKCNIAPLLRLLAVFLILFVLYRTWIKPASLAPSPVRTGAADTGLPVWSADSSGLLEPARNFPEDPGARFSDPGEAPNAMLGRLRDELEKGNVREVESGLRRISAKQLAKGPVRRYVAALWNNVGIQQEKYGGIQLSVTAFKKAVALDPSNAIAHLNLTQAYWGLRDPALTPEFLETVIRLVPTEPFPRLALADLLVERGDPTGASKHVALAEAEALKKQDLHAYARRLARRIELMTASNRRSETKGQSDEVRAHNVPTGAAAETDPPGRVVELYNRRPAASAIAVQQPDRHQYFVVRFDGTEDQEAWTRLRAILEYAYQDICQKFGRSPAAPITIVLHSTERFVDQAGIPAWADRLFDEKTGAIHVPMQGALDDLGALSRVVRHQFVHALLHESLGPRLQAVPVWLVEGVAMQLPDDPWPDLEETRLKGFVAMPLVSTHKLWRDLAGHQQVIAYLEAYVATQALVDRQGIYGVRQLLNAIQAGQSLEAAMKDKLALSYEMFQLEWTKKVKAVHEIRS